MSGRPTLRMVLIQTFFVPLGNTAVQHHAARPCALPGQANVPTIRGVPIKRLLPAVLALLLIAAHFYRDDLPFLVPVCIGLLALLFVRLAWVPAVVALALALGTGEWLRTLLVLANERIAAGQSYARLVVILVGVALFTLLAALSVFSPKVRRWYADGTKS
jgi:hypothetical protein